MIRRVCRRASRLETALETLVVVVSSKCAAAVKLPLWATARKKRMLWNTSIVVVSWVNQKKGRHMTVPSRPVIVCAG
ncbi:hypothetical protein D3C76_1111240 [compost metagenome]